MTLNLLNDPTLVDLLFGGGAGGAKSLTVCIWMLIQLRKYPGIRIGLGRKELTRLKQTTVYTLLYEAHKLIGVKKGEFIYQEHKALVTYANKSLIQLVDLAPQPSDPNYDSLGSYNFTHVVIEEGGEIVKKARDIFISRKNRYKNGEYNIVGRSITTCNPTQNFLKTEYYKPYVDLGGGDYKIWPYGEVEVEGQMKTAYRGFIRSLASDNPFIDRNYIEVLRKLPPTERKRLLEGNWNYEDTDAMLFKPVDMDRATVDTVTPGTIYIGVDIADTGSDKVILTNFTDDIFEEQVNIEVDKNKPIGDQIALAIIKYAQQRGFTPADAKRIAIDGIGVGASTRDFLKSRGWYVRVFIAGAQAIKFIEGKVAPDPMFKNLRGQTVYNFSQSVQRGEVKFYSGMTMLEILREDLAAHEYTTQERLILIKPKDKIKEVLGRSPDNAESAYIAWWCKHGPVDPKLDQGRIIL